MQKMDARETREFLLQGPRTAKFATVREDGRPHVTPVWFDLDGDDIILTAWHTTVKAANLRRDPRVCICVDDDRPPFAYVIIDGLVSFDPDMEHLAYWATRIAGRYMGADLAESFGKRNAVAGELLLRVKPVKVIARKGISD